MGRSAGADVVGLDPDRADELATTWAAMVLDGRELVRHAHRMITELALPPPSAGDGWAAERLTALAAELVRRAGELRALDRGVVTAPAGRGLRSAPRRGPGDGPDGWWAWLLSGGRSGLLPPLAADGSTWSALVADGTRWEGDVARTYTDVAPIPGAGLIVVDMFIPFESSFVLDGDDRGHADPVFGDVGDDDSRVVMVFDLERGRGVVQVHQSCVADGRVCNAARPADLDGGWFVDDDGPGPGVLGGDAANQVRIDSDGSQLTVRYDLLNSIVPVGSTDGTFTLRDEGDGVMAVTELDTDEYPSVGIYQYRPSGETRVLRRHESDDMWTLFPIVPPAVAGALSAHPLDVTVALGRGGPVLAAIEAVDRLVGPEITGTVRLNGAG